MQRTAVLNVVGLTKALLGAHTPNLNSFLSRGHVATITPMYPAVGRKVFDIYTWPFSVRTEIKRDLGEFPFPTFWGPAAGVKTPQGEPDAASRWIADSAKWIEQKYAPTLSLVYLP